MSTMSSSKEADRIETICEELIDKGDFSRIAEIFNRKNHYLKSVTRGYVRLVILGRVNATSRVAKEVLEIANKYFQNKEAFEKEILS